MVYKRYIKRDGKVYGPYVYNSRKENGKVISEYVGKYKQKNLHKKLFLTFGLIGFFCLIFLGFNFYPKMIGFVTYDSSGGKLTAYEKGGALPSNPFDYDNEASSGNYTNTNSRDNNRWMTSSATIGTYDSQIFIFNISEPVGGILSLNISWEGYGETTSGYYTNLSIFNWSSGYWVILNNKDFTSATDSELNSSIIGGFSDFVNSTSNQVALMVFSRKAGSNGESCSVGGECASGYCYRDIDNDNYANATGEKTCQASASLGTDCYDSNANVHPGQTTYFISDRGDGSFDYDCNSINDKDTVNTCISCTSSVSGSCALCSDPAGPYSTWTCACSDTGSSCGVSWTPSTCLLTSIDIQDGLCSYGYHNTLIGQYTRVLYGCGGSWGTSSFQDAGSGSTTSTCSCKSPYIYTYNGKNYNFFSDFLPTATSKDKEYESFTDITDSSEIINNKIKLKITEELNETTYLDNYYLKVFDYNNEKQFNDYFNKNFEKINDYNWKQIKLEKSNKIIKYNIQERSQDKLILNSDNRYLVMEKGFEKELEFNVPELKEGYERKIFFVAEGYYIEHDKNKIKEIPHRSLYTDYIQLNVETYPEYPIFTNIDVNVTNNTGYSLGLNYRFNSTITNTNGSAGIEFNGINYSLSNTSSHFYATIGNLGTGIYSYYFWAYGNGTSSNYNTSSVYSYTVAKGTSEVAGYIQNTRNNVSIDDQTTSVRINASLLTGVGNITLYWNDSLFNNGTSPLTNTTDVSIGTYNLTIVYLGNENYTGDTEIWYLTVSTYVAPVSPSGGSGGSGGGSSTPSISFSIDKDVMHLIVKQTETERQTLLIKNIGSSDINIQINYSEVSDFVVITEDSFPLQVGQSKTINLDFFAREKEIPEVYTGRIIVQAGTIKKIINVIFEVKERVPLFDLRVDVSNKKVIPDDILKFDILAINMGDLTGFDILLHYSIKDFQGNVYEVKEESIKIDTQLDLKRTLIVPSNLSLGKYILYSKISYQNITATGIDTFEVMSKEALQKYKIIQFIIVMLIIIISFSLLWVLIKKK